MTPGDFDAIRRSVLFGNLDRSLVDEIVGDRVPRLHPKGRVLFLEGDRLDTLHLVVSGWVRLTRTSEDGGETVVAVHGRGESFGEAAALLAIPAHAGAETVCETRILTLDAERLRNRLTADPDLAFRMLASASMHLRVMVDELERLKSRSATRRLAGFLADLADRPQGRAEVALPHEKVLIAARLGMTPESFSRGLARLRDHGVGVEREKVTIARVEALRAFAEGGDVGSKRTCR